MFRGKKKKRKELDKAFDSLKVNILTSLEDGDKTLLFTSSSKDVKKTSPILHLARRMADDKKEVLLIDMNLRNPLVSKLSKVEFNKGFSDILVEDCPYENTITNDLYQKDLDLILSGRAMKNPDDFLEMAKLRNLLDYVREKYDYILIDSPSNESYKDANIIAQSVDKVVVFTNEKDLKDKKADQSLSKLEKVDGEILGLVLTDVN